MIDICYNFIKFHYEDGTYSGINERDQRRPVLPPEPDANQCPDLPARNVRRVYLTLHNEKWNAILKDPKRLK